MKLLGSIILGFFSWKCGEVACATYHLFGTCDPNTVPGVITCAAAFVSLFAGLGTIAIWGYKS